MTNQTMPPLDMAKALKEYCDTKLTCDTCELYSQWGCVLATGDLPNEWGISLAKSPVSSEKVEAAV